VHRRSFPAALFFPMWANDAAPCPLLIQPSTSPTSSEGGGVSVQKPPQGVGREGESLYLSHTDVTGVVVGVDDLSSLAALRPRPTDASLRGQWPHPLRRVDPLRVYPHLNGGWQCDECGACPEASAPMYHCFRTGTFDLCASCLRDQKGYIDDAEIDDEPLPALADEDRDGSGSSSVGPSDGIGGSPSRSAQPRGWRQPGGGDAHGSGVSLERSRQDFFDVCRGAPASRREVSRVGAVVSTHHDTDVTASPRPHTVRADGGGGGGGGDDDDDDAQTRRLTELFHKIDVDHSGSVSAREWWEGMAASSGIEHDRETWQALARRADTDGEHTPQPP
jgi:hypothetical protein